VEECVWTIEPTGVEVIQEQSMALVKDRLNRNCIGHRYQKNAGAVGINVKENCIFY
jgi:hypothetical protein